jgi:hypothetical protein
MTDHAQTSADLATSLLMRRIVVSLAVQLAIVIALGSGLSLHGLLHWSGEALLVTGILMAAKGISDVRSAWTEIPGWYGVTASRLRKTRDVGARAFWSSWNAVAMHRWLARLGARPHITRVVSIGAVLPVKLSVSAEMKVGWPAPPVDGTVEERLAWLEGHLLSTRQQLDALQEARRQESKDISAAAEQERTQRIAEAQRIRKNIANLAGDGLRLQAWGVTCLLAGTVLTAIYV